LVSTRAQHVATEAALRQARSERARAQDAIGQIEGINARLAAAQAAVHSAELDLSYCRVRAPFTGLVVNMNISNGAFARAGVEVFTLVDTRTWYVVANFRETQLRHIPAGAPVDLYLQSQPSKHFRGTVVGLGWAGCRKTAQASMACRAWSAPSTGSVSPRAFRYASKWIIRMTPSASAPPR
jgi:membrane fusion protein, multidrug efflux system